MNDFNPLVSIVIPVYNGSNYLREAIDSALAQTYKNFEIIVVNDGSKDNTEEIAKSYGDKIRYFSKPNGGISSTLNFGIKNMRGDYFSWLSHDDLYYPNKIERAVEELSKLENKNTIIISEWECIDENYYKKNTSLNKKHMNAYPGREHSYLYPIVYNRTHGCTHLISKIIFDTVGLFDERLLASQDYEFFYRAFAKFPNKLIPEVLVTVRDPENRQTRILYLRLIIESSLLYIKILENLSEKEILEMVPNKKSFLLDMEELFIKNDLSIALEYIELIAEEEKIKTKLGKRKGMYNTAFMWAIRAIKQYGIINSFNIYYRRVKAKHSKRK